MSPAQRGRQLESEVSPALRRIAEATLPERAAPEGDGLARAAIAQAVGIRRRRRLAGAAVAAAVVVAVAVPLVMRPGSSVPVPAGPTMGSVSRSAPTVGATKPVTPRVTARVTANLPALRESTGPSIAGRVVRPYVVDGVYHGESGTVRLGSQEQLRGLVDVLNLAGGARVLRLEPPGGPVSTVVQSAGGREVLRLPAVSGPTVADASGTRFAMLDVGTESLTLRDQRGTVLEQTQAPGIRSIAGFAGNRVLVTNDAGAALWNLASGAVEPWTSDRALDASDAAAAALLLSSVDSGVSCWSVRSTTERGTPAASHCGSAVPIALTADGRYVLAREGPSNGQEQVLVLDASTGEPALAVEVDEDATVTQTGFRIGQEELVLDVVGRHGGHRLVGCTLKGRCESLTSTVSAETSRDLEPYLLVRD